MKKPIVKMDYVVLGLLAAFAIAVAVLVFGRSVKSEFNVAPTAVSGAK